MSEKWKIDMAHVQLWAACGLWLLQSTVNADTNIQYSIFKSISTFNYFCPSTDDDCPTSWL